MSRFADLGHALRALRVRRKLTGKDLATALGVQRTLVSRWECGVDVPTLTTLGKLADHYRLHLGDLDDVLADVGGHFRPHRPVSPPTHPAEVEALLDDLVGPADPGDEVTAALRGSLAPLLLFAGRRRAAREGGGGG